MIFIRYAIKRALGLYSKKSKSVKQELKRELKREEEQSNGIYDSGVFGDNKCDYFYRIWNR